MMEEGESGDEGTDLSEHGARSSTATSADDEASYCNPEPPPELEGPLLNADNIGETVFSKHWLFTTLMKLIQAIDGQENGKEDTHSGSETHDLDIDTELQDELCKLWDMSMNPEVVKFLQEFKAIDILTGVIAKSRAPRATEICVGILGNMACNEDVCGVMVENEKLVKLLLILLESSDSPTLVELTRLLHACVSSKRSGGAWISAIKNDATVFTHISFILQSSTNSELLLNVGDLVGKLLYAEDSLCRAWGSSGLVLGCLEVLKQTGCDPGSDSLETFLHILQLVSTCEPGVEALVSYGAELINLIMKYLLSICEEEVIGVEGKENTIGSALSILNILVASWEDRNKFIQEDFQLIRCVLKILQEVYPKYNAEHCAGVRRQRSKSEVPSSPPPYSPYITDSQENLARTPRKGKELNTSLQTEESSSLFHDVSQKVDVDSTSLESLSNKSENKSLMSPHNAAQKQEMDSSEKDTLIVDSSQTAGAGDSSSCFEKVNSKDGGPLVDTHVSFGHRGGSGTPQHRTDEYDAKMMQMLFDVIQACLVETTVVLKEIAMPKDISRKTQDLAATDEGITIDFEVGIPETLDYLDQKCPSPRLRFMFLLLKDANATEGLDLINIYCQLGKKFDTQKLNRILSEFS